MAWHVTLRMTHVIDFVVVVHSHDSVALAAHNRKVLLVRVGGTSRLLIPLGPLLLALLLAEHERLAAVDNAVVHKHRTKLVAVGLVPGAYRSTKPTVVVVVVMVMVSLIVVVVVVVVVVMVVVEVVQVVSEQKSCTSKSPQAHRTNTRRNASRGHRASEQAHSGREWQRRHTFGSRGTVWTCTLHS
jgi:hypothetical protein